MKKNTSFKVSVSGVLDFGEQCRIQYELQKLFKKLGYSANISNFNFNIS